MLCHAGTADSSITQELADLEGVLEDMYEKVEELQQVLKEHLSTKNALKVSLVFRPRFDRTLKLRKCKVGSMVNVGSIGNMDKMWLDTIH